MLGIMLIFRAFWSLELYIMFLDLNLGRFITAVNLQLRFLKFEKPCGNLKDFQL